MTVTTTDSRISYKGDGASTTFPFPFYFLLATDLRVYVAGSLLTLGYTVSGAGKQAGGSVTISPAPAAGVPIVLLRDPDSLQNTALPPNDPFPSKASETVWDKLTMLIQRLIDRMSRTPQLADFDVDGSGAYRANGNRIRDLALPVNQNDAATRAFVEASITNAAAIGVSAAPVVNSIAALRSLSKLVVSRVFATGYYEAGDGGGGSYWYDPSDTTTADNGGTVIVAADGGRWKLQVIGGRVCVDQFGAKGDNSTESATFCQNALNSGYAVVFSASKTYKIGTALTVPVTCPAVHGKGSTINGPGAASSVDGFKFDHWYDGNGNEVSILKSGSYHLPAIQNFRRGIYNAKASWVYVECDLIKYCGSGVTFETAANFYIVECHFKIGTLANCDNGLEFIVPADSGGVYTEGVQGCRFDVLYLTGCNKAIAGTTFTTTSSFTYNEFYATVIDANGASGGTGNAYAIWFAANSTKNVANKYYVPCGPINTFATPSPFVNAGVDGGAKNIFDMLYFQGTTTTPFAFDGFLASGPVTTVDPAFGTMTVYVATTGSDATGNGSIGAPFATINKAMAYIQNLDMRGHIAMIKLAAGTYSDGLLYDSTYGLECGGKVVLSGVVGDPGAVTITGGIQADGATSILRVQFVTITGSIGIIANHDASIDYSNVVFGTVASSHVTATIGSRVVASGPYLINGPAQSFVQTSMGGAVILDNQTATVSGTPGFSNAFAFAVTNGMISATGATFSGAATGTRYNAVLNGVITTGGGGANFFPGNVAGGVSLGGQYF